ncbi:MAG TPA: fused MFS/spermidine synthase, partial [Myxococcales bacterium]|nr:fused MFS/spermidine synthase [Myxococcales bacterium]
LLKDLFGITAYAVAVVLATFLGGLALGAWFLGRRVDCEPKPLRFYGLLEIGVGAAALVGTFVLRILEPIHQAAAVRWPPRSPTLFLIRVAIASLVVVPPTLLMGATLPAITRDIVARVGKVGRELSVLYALNTAGAVAGSFVAGFVLIRAIGVHPTLGVAVAANVAVGIGALLLAARDEALSEAADEPRPAAARASDAGLLVAVALSGFVSLALEVVWTRVLVLVVGSSTHAFVTMLAAFLVGISLGSGVTRLFVDRLKDPRRAFGWVQVGIAAATLAAIPAMNELVARAQQWMFALEERWLALSFGRFAIAFAIMLVPTFFIGMVFPIAATLHVRGTRSLGGDLGRVYGALTLGNIAGAVLAALVLLPAAGMQRAILFASAASLASAAWGFFPGAGKPRPWLRIAPAVAVTGVWIALLVAWRPRPFISAEEAPGDPVRFYQEGLVSTVKVIQRAADGRQLVMLVDGVRIGQSSAGIDNKQQVLAHFPFLLRPGRPPARVLSIGLGTGILSGEVARHPGVREIDCVELSPSVIEGAAQFGAYNFDVLHDSRVRIVEDDGINFLARAPGRYDAIISDGKSRLGQAGNSLFYSQEYYRNARRHLERGGLMIQWMPLEEVPEDLRIIVRTFMAEFPHAYLFLAHDSAFLVGMEEPLAIDLPALQREMDSPAAADLRRYGWRDAAEVATLLVADRNAAAPWLATEDTINSLEHPVLEFYSARALAESSLVRRGENAAAIAAIPQEKRNVPVSGADRAALDAWARALGGLLSALHQMGHPDAERPNEAFRLLIEASAEAPAGGVIRSWASAALLSGGVAAEDRGDAMQAFHLYRAAVVAWPESVNARIQLGRAWAMQGEFREAAGEFKKALELNPESGAAHKAFAQLLRQVGDPYQAIGHYREALRIAPGQAEVHADLGQSLALAGRPDEGLAEFREAISLEPRASAPMAMAAMVLATNPNVASRNSHEAVRLALRANELTGGRDSGVLEVLAASYAAGGRFEEAVAAERKALDLVSAKADPQLVAEMEAALDLYKRGLTRR